MGRFLAIATNAFLELVRQPVFLLLMTTSAGFSVFLAAVPYFGFGDDPKLVKDSTLAVMLLSGLFGAILSASAYRGCISLESNMSHELTLGEEDFLAGALAAAERLAAMVAERS